MKVTSKGQVTIPQSVRNALGIHPHSDIEFEVKGTTAILRKARGSSRGKLLVEKLRGKSSVHMTTDEIMSLTRGK